MDKKHGLKNAAGPHAGDLPDMYVEKNGTGRYEVLIDSMTLGSGETSIFDADGSAIIIHVTADDNVTDPAGNSGDRIACGVITKAAAKGSRLSTLDRGFSTAQHTRHRSIRFSDSLLLTATQTLVLKSSPSERSHCSHHDCSENDVFGFCQVTLEPVNILAKP